MLREVSDSLFEFLNEAFPTNKSYTRNDIEQDPMPPLLAHFLGQNLQHRLDVEVEHLRTVRSSWFDYDHPDVQHAYKSFVAALAQYSHIPAEEWRSTLKRATKLVIAHLILPTHTLVEFVFREEDGPLAAPVIYREISYFAAYPYLREAVETFLKKRQLKEIDRTRFSSLLTQVDRHMTANYTVDQWMRMLRPLFDLMRRVPQTSKQGVPIDMLAMFFGDKEAYEIQGRLQVEKEVHRISTIDEAGLRRVIDGSVGPFEQELKATPPVAAPAAKPEAVNEPVTPSYLPAEDAPAPVEKPEPKAPPAEKESKPLWERFQRAGTKKEEPATPTQPAPAEGDADDAVPLWMRFQKPGVTPVAANLKPSTEPGPRPPLQTKDTPPAAPAQPVAVPAPEETPPEVTPPGIMEDRQPTPSQTDYAAQTEPVRTYANQFAPPPPSPYGTQDTPPVFSDSPRYEAPQYNMPEAPEAQDPDETQLAPDNNPEQPVAPDPVLSPLESLEYDVLGSFGATNRTMFVDHLFAGSEQGYEHLLGVLRELSTWEEASQLIAEEVFKKHQINIYSPAAIMFTESVEEQYRQR